MQENSITYQPDSLNINQDSLSTQQKSQFIEVISDNFLYCFPDDSPEYLKNPIISETPTFNPTTEKISENPKLFDSIFIIFLVCFIIISRILSSKARMFLSVPEELFRLKERKSIFNESVGNELYAKLLLSFQTIIILSIFLYLVFVNNKNSDLINISEFYESIGKICLLFVVFLFYKWISYNTVGKIFFRKEALSQWLNNFISLICLLGITIFIPVLLMFYVGWMYSFCYFFILFCILIVILIIVYRTYVLFFHNIRYLHYLFLYLCAQEIAPLLVLYQGLVCIT